MLSSFLFPSVCIACRRLLRTELILPLCSLCWPKHVPLPPEQRVMANIEAMYAYEGPLADSLQSLKFSGQAELAGPLGNLLANSHVMQTDPPWDLVIPVPLHAWREFYRGYNQSTLLVQWMLKHIRKRKNRTCVIPVLAKGLLRRCKATAAQSTLDVHQRKLNVQGAFCLTKDARSLIKGRRVLIVDDVTTTGATLHACMESMQKAGAADIAGLALLRTLA